jgi:ankyrin repeat protein
MTFDRAHRLIRLETSLLYAANWSRFSWTLLMLAAMTGNTTIGELLISRGAAVDRVNDFGETALSLAAHAGHVPFLRLLLAKGASIDVRPHGHTLRDWMTISTGLAPEKICDAANAHRRRAN